MRYSGTGAAVGVLPTDAADPQAHKLVTAEPGEQPGDGSSLHQFNEHTTQCPPRSQTQALVTVRDGKGKHAPFSVSKLGG